MIFQIRTTSAVPFGDSFSIKDKIPKDCQSIVVGVNTGTGIKPLRLMMPHQLYAEDVKKIFNEYGNTASIAIIPIRSYETFAFTLGDINPEWQFTKLGQERFGKSGLMDLISHWTAPDYVPDNLCFVAEGMGVGAFYRVGREIKWTEYWEPEKNDMVVAKFLGGRF
jgi:hypothetical protein